MRGWLPPLPDEGLPVARVKPSTDRGLAGAHPGHGQSVSCARVERELQSWNPSVSARAVQLSPLSCIFHCVSLWRAGLFVFFLFLVNIINFYFIFTQNDTECEVATWSAPRRVPRESRPVGQWRALSVQHPAPHTLTLPSHLLHLRPPRPRLSGTARRWPASNQAVKRCWLDTGKMRADSSSDTFLHFYSLYDVTIKSLINVESLSL